MKLFHCLFIAIFFASGTFAQEKQLDAPEEMTFAAAEDSLIQLATTFLTDKDQQNRIDATARFKPLLKQTLSKPDSYAYPFDSLIRVSIQYPEDSTFRIFTWQLFVDDNNYQYGGFIQRATTPDKPIELVDLSHEVEEPDYEYLSPDNWYGVVYYNIKRFDTPKGRKYLLFGFYGLESCNNRKIAHVLTFGKDEIISGAPVFAKVEEGRRPITKNRLVLEYSAETRIRLNYDETLEHIIHDHLKFKNGSYGQGDTLVGDGSYEGFFLNKDGLWVHVAKMFDQVSEEPPRPNPILDNRKKNIFGRSNEVNNQ